MPHATGEDWDFTTPAEAGFIPDAAKRLDAAFAAGRLPHLHAVVVVRDGKLVLERYYRGIDEAWGKPLGDVAFTPEVLHDLRSVTKSIVGLLYGIALAEGKVPMLDQPVVESFPSYPGLAADAARRRITIAHLLSMTAGLEWNEDVPYNDAANSEIAMETAPDRYRFILERPIVAAPGTTWTYNGGCTALLGHLIARGTGRSLTEYVRDKLFHPLGISAFVWTPGFDGRESAASGLRMRPRDLAKIGKLMLANGAWNGRQIVPQDWLEESVKTRVALLEGMEYGYQWWLGGGKQEGDERVIVARGNGGQRLVIVPALDLAAAILCGNYNRPDQVQVPATVMREYIAGALRG